MVFSCGVFFFNLDIGYMGSGAYFRFFFFSTCLFFKYIQKEDLLGECCNWMRNPSFSLKKIHEKQSLNHSGKEKPLDLLI